MDYCTYNDEQASCSLDLGKLGTLNSYTFVDACVNPPEMDMNLELSHRGRWEFRFVSGNQAESRALDLRIWPLKLHVDFSNPAVMSTGHSEIKACLESVKTGHMSCFLNHTFAIPTCSAQSAIFTFSWPMILSLLLLLTVLISVVTLAAVCCRRFNQSKYSRHTDESSSCRSSSQGSDGGKDMDDDGLIDPPLLPSAIPYPEEEGEGRGGKCKGLAREKRHYKPYNVHFADEIDCFVGGGMAEKYFSADSPNSADSGLSTFSGKSCEHKESESKQIQTSITSLDAGYSSPLNPVVADLNPPKPILADVTIV